MTPSSIRPRSARRHRLLAASALCGVATMLAQPVLAGTLPGIPSAANITVSTGGSQPFISFPDAITLQIELNAPRTVINWTDLHLSSGDAMNFLFDAASDIVLNKTTSQIRFDNGSVVTGKIGAATAGNVWFYSPQGVIVSPGATMTAGGFLFSKGSGLVDASFVDSAAPLTFLRSAADALIQITTISSATSASINSSGDVVLSASNGALNVSTAVGATVDISTTSGSITASEVTATSGAAGVAAGGPGATVTQISGATGVTVSSGVNTSVGAATTTTSGDILLTSNTGVGSVSLTLGNSARDVTLSADEVYTSTIDAERDVFVTGGSVAYVTNRIFAGDDIEITASAGDVNAGGAYLKSTGMGASDDAHILLRSDTGSVNAGNTLLTQGTGAQAGDITIQAATTASLGTATSTRDIKVAGVSASLTNGSAARDLFVTATTGDATVVTAATAGDDVEVTTASGDVLASAATLKSTGVGATDDAHVLAKSISGAVNVGSGITQGTGVAAGDVTIQSADSSTLGAGSSSRDLTVTGSDALSLTGAYSATGTASFTSGTGAITQSGGSITAGLLTADAASGIVLTQTGNNVTNLGAIDSGTGSFTYRDSDSFGLTDAIISGGDVSLTSGSGAITQTAGTITADVLNVTAASGIALNKDNLVNSLGVMNNTTSGALSFRDADGFDITDNIDSAGNVSLFTTSGDITHSAGTLHAGGAFSLDSGGLIAVGDVDAGGDIGVTAAGDIDVNSATVGGGVSLMSTGGHAILRKAVLTGSGASNDLSISADGDAILGADDDSSITTDNVFSRTGGGTGTASVSSSNGYALVFLDSSEAFDTLEGTSVFAFVNNGLLKVDTGTATAGDLYLQGEAVEAGTLQASGVTAASAVNGNLSVQSAEAGTGVSFDADGDVFVDRARGVQGVIVGASGEVLVNFAQATDPAGFIAVMADGNATLRGAEAPVGILVESFGGIATFGADDLGSIVTDNYVVTGSGAGCGCGGPAPVGLQVVADSGDAVVNVNSISNPITLVSASTTGSASVALTSGDLKIDTVLGKNITLNAADGTLETGFAGIDDGDYTISAHDFLGNALAPTPSSGVIHDVTITDTLGDLDLGTAAIHADHWLTITASNGAVKGAAQLSAGSGLNDARLVVTGDGIALDTVTSDGLVTLEGGNGLVDVATSLDVWGNYSLRGGDFANAALTPQGDMLGTWAINDRVGGFDFTGKTLHYGGALLLFVDGVVNGGDITVDVGNIYAEVDSGHLGTLTAPLFVGATSIDGGIDVDLIQAGTTARVWATDFGTARLGAAVMTGTGATQVQVEAYDGDAILGAATPGAITAANLVTSTGATSTVSVTASTGRVDINLDHLTGSDLTTVTALRAADIKVASGALTVQQLTAGADSQVNGGGDTRLVSADVTGDLTVASATGNLRFGDATPGRVIDVSGALTLDAATDIAQQGALHALALGVTSGTGAVLLGANEVSYLDAVSVSAGGFAFNDTLAFGLYGPVNAVGQTVDLRSDHAIGQVSTGVITAQTLTGSSVGGANFGAANQVVRLGDFTNTGGLLKLVDGRSLTVAGTVLSTGTVALTSHTGMTFTGAGAVTANGTGDAIILASDGTFTNARGADAVTATNAAGRWLIYTQAVGNASGSTAANSFNGLAGKSFYGSAYDFSNEVLAMAPDAGNRFVYAYRPTLTVMPDSRVVTYDGSVPTTSATITGLVNGDAAVDAWSGAAVVLGATSKAAGTYLLTAAGGTLASDLNYAFAYGTGSLRIDPKVLTGVLTADDKTYDRSAATTGLVTLSGVISGDTVAAAGTYAFGDWNAGSGKIVTATGMTLSGGDAGNYSLGAVSSDTADIFKKAITGALTADDKTYDRTTAATGVVTLSGVVLGDAVAAGGAYAFGDRSAGSGKTVTVTGVTLYGGDAGNYSLGAVSSDTADILKKAITGALAASNKTYDGATTASGAIVLTGVVAGDTVSAAGVYAFADKNAGTGKTVTVSGATLAGLDSANYDLSGVSSGLADILRRSVTVSADSGFKGQGHFDPSLTYRITVGDLVAGDAFTGGLAREVGETAGGYAITRGTLALSANYDLTFTGAVFTIDPPPSNEQDGSTTLKHINASPDFTLDWDPEPNLETQGAACSGEGCPSSSAATGVAKVVASLR